MAHQALIELLRQISTEAVASGKPTSVIYGKVISKHPLKIQVNNKLILDESFLVLTKNVLDHKVKFTMDFRGEEPGKITINGEQNVLDKMEYKKGYAIIKNGLNIGDTAIMVQQQGGQKFVVVDKMNNDWTDDDDD